jgi:hypothetical protein
MAGVCKTIGVPPTESPPPPRQGTDANAPGSTTDAQYVVTRRAHAVANLALRTPLTAPKKQHSDQQWDEMKPEIHRLYLEEGKTLEEVMFTMSSVHDFKPT